VSLNSIILLPTPGRLLIASDYDPLEVLENLTPYVAGSGSIVVQSPFSQVCCAVISMNQFSWMLGLASRRTTIETASKSKLSCTINHGIMAATLSSSTRSHAPDDEHIRIRRFLVACNQSVSVNTGRLAYE